MKSPSHLPPIEETELVLEELFRNMPVGMLLSDLHGTLLDVNDALCEMLGYEHRELVGHTITEFTHPDDLAETESRISDLREGRVGQYKTLRRYIARNGSTIYANVSVSIVYTRDGEPICGIGMFENITERVEMEAKLRHSELRYRRIVEDQTDLIVRCLPDGTRTFVNEAYARYNESTQAQLLGTSFFKCMAPEEERIVREKFARLTPSNPVITDQHWVVGPDGAMRWHEWTDRGFFNESGQLVQIQSVGRDLTEQHEAQQRLVESEERYRRLFNDLPVAVWENDWSRVIAEMRRRGLTTPEAMIDAITKNPALFYELGATVSVPTVNPAALAMAGVSNVGEFDRWLGQAATPETALRFSQVAPALVFGDRTSIMDEYTLIRASGEPIEVLIRIARSARWEEAHTLSTIAVDVTERKRIQRELEQKQEMTERAEAAARFGSWEWNPRADELYGSPQFWRILDGRDGGGPAHRPLAVTLASMDAEDRERVLTRWNALLLPSDEERPTEFTTDYRLPRADGSMDIARGRNFAMYAEDGSMIRAFGILQDVTEQKRVEEEAVRHRDELVRADKMISLGILVSGMAHEINNPNHSIGLNAPLVRDAWRDATALLDDIAAKQPSLRIGRLPWSEARGEVKSMIDDIEDASERIRLLVNELRGFALDHDPGERREISVNNIVHGAMRLLRKHIARATKHFERDLAADVPLILGNSRRLEQVVVNLVLNACQALENDRQAIRITTGCDEQRVFIRVRDEGRGISPDDLAKIRTPFFTTKRAEGGTGLGVPVSDRIAGEHGGEVTFDSAPGRGTTATLWLPRTRT